MGFRTNWAQKSAVILWKAFSQSQRSGLRLSVLLTGGRSAGIRYEEIPKQFSLPELTGIDFYLGDERCVNSNHPESNYGLIMRTLFKGGIPNDCCFYDMGVNSIEYSSIVKAYSGVIPDVIDIGLFGVGDDGHIASIFPNSPATTEYQKKLVFVSMPDDNDFDRITVTPKVISTIRQVFLLAPDKKKKFRGLAAKNPTNVGELPVRLVNNATWLS